MNQQFSDNANDDAINIAINALRKLFDPFASVTRAELIFVP